MSHLQRFVDLNKGFKEINFKLQPENYLSEISILLHNNLILNTLELIWKQSNKNPWGSNGKLMGPSRFPLSKVISTFQIKPDIPISITRCLHFQLQFRIIRSLMTHGQDNSTIPAAEQKKAELLPVSFHKII